MRRSPAQLTMLVLMVAAVSGLSAQEAATGQGMPEGWLMRLDRPDAGPDEVEFRVLDVGWHVTTGRAGAAIFWQPGTRADGGYTVSTTMHLFHPAEHAESFGLFFGGRSLNGVGQEYVYFLVRQTGEYLIKRRAGEETETLVEWTAHEAVPEMAPGAEAPTQYDLAAAVQGEEVAFLVNGETVHTLPAAELRTDGAVGVRVNHMLDVHIESLTVAGSGVPWATETGRAARGETGGRCLRHRRLGVTARGGEHA
ncbi:MAG: hypothetical protein ACOC5I_03160, partial [Gemmatimonadota bacterium]